MKKVTISFRGPYMLQSLLTVFFFFTGLLLVGQEKVFYLDPCENLVSDSSYHLKRRVKKHPEKKFTYIFTDYYRNGQVFTSGICKSRNGKIKVGDFVFYKSNGQKLASGYLDRDQKKGPWEYWRNDSTKIGLDHLIEEFPVISISENGVKSTGKCICYKKQGLWTIPGTKTDKTKSEYYEDGVLIAENNVYNTIDEPATYIGGMQEFRKYLRAELKYPLITRLKQRQGEVLVQFIINENGDLLDPTFLASLDKPTKKRIKSVLLKTSGRWQPAIYKKRKVGSKMILPIDFELTR